MLRIFLLALVVLALVVVVRTALYAPAAVEVTAPGESIDIDEAQVLDRLGQAIGFATISRQPPAPLDAEAFEGFLGWLEATYPRVFQSLEVRRVGGYSLLLTWRGQSAAADPVLLAAHYDVVPVVPGSESAWTHPPFAGRLADGYVWGRGALDNKNAVVALMESVDWLLARGETPARTVYLSFGHDEEVGGERGAAAVVEHLRDAGVRLAWSLDEGSFVFRDMFPGVDVPIATINIAEKGSVNMRIVASAAGGHSSMPPQQTATGRLARALVALEDNPLPGGLEGVAADSFDAIAPHMPLLPRMMFANRWLFGPVVEGQLESLPFANAMMRTTTAPTMLSASPKVNVLPIEAVATVNFRVHPRDKVADVVNYVEDLVAGEHVRVEASGGSEASAVADPDSAGFRLLADVVRREFPDAVVAPGLLVAATDTRHYGQIAEDALRFNPMVVTEAEVEGFHGTNERISAAGMVQGVRTYIRLLREL
ncbi:MAG: M20 family peptidase [Gammaproteobacteria bacterium]|nr:M20 family peptidase [Gammaproteobacteria bacterium]